MRIPGPGDVLRVAAQSFEAAQVAIGLVPRLVSMVADVEALIRRVQVLVGQIEAIPIRVNATIDRVHELQAGVDEVRRTAAALVGRTADVVEDAAALTDRVQPILATYEPILQTLQPSIARLARTTSPQEIDAVIALIDMLPAIAGKLDRDILPVLDTLATVAPDLRDLLDVSKELNELIGAVPGLGRVKKRIEERQQEQDDYRADEEPPAAPDRGPDGRSAEPPDAAGPVAQGTPEPADQLAVATKMQNG